MLCYKGVAQFEMIMGCSIVEGSMSLEVGFEVSKVHAKPGVSLFLLPAYLAIELLATSLFLWLSYPNAKFSATMSLYATMLPTLRIMD